MSGRQSTFKSTSQRQEIMHRVFDVGHIYVMNYNNKLQNVEHKPDARKRSQTGKLWSRFLFYCQVKFEEMTEHNSPI